MSILSNKEEKNNNRNQKEYNNPPQIILNICYNPETGKLTLSDNYNNHYSCDLFGRIKKKFLPNVTGTASYHERKIKTKEKYKMPKTTNNFYPKEKGLIAYYPQTRKFDGYFNFPRPLSPPFCNVPENIMSNQTKHALISHLEKYFSDNKSKKYVGNYNLNVEMSYLTGDLNEFDSLKVESEKLLKLIKNTLDSIKKEYALKMNMFNKLPMVKALRQFKKYIIENKESILINNHKLKKPIATIKKKYDIIHKTITNFGLKRDKFKNFHQLKLDSLYNDNITKEEKIKHLTLDNFYKKEPIDKNTMMAKIFTNDFNIGRQINMNFGHFYYQDYTKNETQENTKTTNTNEKNKIIETNLNKETQVTKETKETEESLYVKTIDEKIKKNNLSFISKALDNENIFKKNQNKKIKQMKYIKNNFFKEKKLLKGFETEERKGPILLIKSLKPKLKTNGELFDENMKLLKRTNPIAFQLQEKKDEFDLKQLRKKVNMLKINEGNVMKGKKLIINKDENKDE